MIFGTRSNYMMKYQKAKAKLVEYDTPAEEYPHFALNSNELSLPTTYIISKYAEAIIENNQADIIEFEPLLSKSAQYYDAAFNSKDRRNYDTDFLLSGASAYFLSNDFGSSKVLIKTLFSIFHNGNKSPQLLLLNVYAYLLLQNKLSYIKVTDTYSKINNAFLDCFEKGTEFSELKSHLTNYRQEVYDKDDPDEVFFVDILVASIYKAIENSSWVVLPKYSDVPLEGWEKYLKTKSSIKMLWPAQYLVAEKDILRGENAVVQLPTGVGKTKSIELIIRAAFLAERANTAMVVAPLRALCNEITTDMHKSFRNVATINQFSDVLQNDFLALFGSDTEKQILVCTPEKLSYIMHHQPDILDAIDLFLFDEGHMFDDGGRGVTYELLVTHIRNELTENQQLVLLSAVLPNSNEIKEWLVQENGVLATDPNILSTPKSIGFVSAHSDIHFYTDDPHTEDYYVPRVLQVSELERRPRERNPRKFPDLSSSIDIAIYNAMKLCHNGGVAIYIGLQRSMKTVFNRLIELSERGLNFSAFTEISNSEELNKIKKHLEYYYGAEHYYTKACNLGILPHSSNLPNGIKLAVESAVKNGYVSCVVCTSTLAQGVNMPIKYLLVTSIHIGQELIKARNFQNLIGRTARSGIYTEGSIIITDPRIYDGRTMGRGRYVWRDCISLFDPNSSEKCSSSILSLVRNLEVDYDTIYKGTSIAKHILQNFNDPNCYIDLAETINAAYLAQKPSRTQNNIWSEILFKQEVLSQIENYLCLAFVYNNTEQTNQEIAISACQSTLAYALATDEEKTLIEQFFLKIEEKLQKYTKEQLRSYSYGMSGVDLSSKIEEWIIENEVTERVISEEDLLFLIVEFFLQNEECKLKDKLYEICCLWIKGKTPIEISIETGCDIYDVDDVCNKMISYRLNILIGNICDLINVPEDDDTKVNPYTTLNILQNKIKYGVSSQTAISICEKIFNDRVLASKLSELLMSSTIDTDSILRIAKWFEDDIFALLNNFPEYFSERFKYLIR